MGLRSPELQECTIFARYKINFISQNFLSTPLPPHYSLVNRTRLPKDCQRCISATLRKVWNKLMSLEAQREKKKRKRRSPMIHSQYQTGTPLTRRYNLHNSANGNLTMLMVILQFNTYNSNGYYTTKPKDTLLHCSYCTLFTVTNIIQVTQIGK